MNLSKSSGALILAILPGLALADDSNFRPYVVGGRAAGLAGAFTAIADDSSGPYYNPGGIAFARRTSLSLSASVYGIATGSIDNALGDGHAFTFKDLQVFPVSTAAVFKFGERSLADEAPLNSIGLSAFVPDAYLQDDRDSIVSRQNAFFLSNNSQTVWGGATYARRFGRVGIGASAFLLFGTATSFLDLTAINNQTNSRFVTLTARTDTTLIGVVGALGLRWDIDDHWKVGASIFSPELALSGQRKSFARVAAGDNVTGQPAQAAVITRDDLHLSPTLPLRAQVGVAWTRGKFTLAADGIFLGPVNAVDNPELASEGLSRKILRDAVVDGALGIEYIFGESFPFRVGTFTDLAAAPTPRAQARGANSADNTSHINRFGGTSSIGFKTFHTETNLGVIVSYGEGTDLIAPNFDFSNLAPSRSTQFLGYVFLSTTYEF